jgi:ketosteroid isomerase-like protein
MQLEKTHAVSVSVLDDRRIPDLLDWLTQFARAVRDVDYPKGRTLFAPDVVSFGTVNEILAGLDELEARQWRNVWGVTRGFDFDYASVQTHVKGDAGWAVALWSSQGRNAGGWFDRHGRCTFVFEKRHGRWLAVHSHFSLVPPSKI